MNYIPRDMAQMLITKLDLGHVKPSEVKTLVKRLYGVDVSGRTADQVAKSVGKSMECQS